MEINILDIIDVDRVKILEMIVFCRIQDPHYLKYLEQFLLII